MTPITRSARPDVQAYLDMTRANDGPAIVDLEPAVARAITGQAGAMIERPARPMRRQDLSITGRDGAEIALRSYHPVERSAQDAAPVVVFYHGGGWVLGDIAGYDALCSEIAGQLGFTLVSVGYRLAPEHRFPAAIHDAIDAARWVVADTTRIGHPVSGLILAGDSAGGTLAAATARELRHETSLLAQWLLYPVTDLSRLYPSDAELSALFNLTEEGKERFYRYYLGDDNFDAHLRHPDVSPLRAQEWDALPPAVVFTCALDPLRDQGRAYAAALASHGIATLFLEADQVHASFTMRQMLPSAQDDLVRNIRVLKLLIGSD